MKDNIVSLFKHLENNRITFPWRQDRWILDIDIYDTDKGNYSPIGAVEAGVRLA